jgi:hypothetical protein
MLSPHFFVVSRNFENFPLAGRLEKKRKKKTKQNMTTDKPVLNCMHFHPHLLNLAA